MINVIVKSFEDLKLKVTSFEDTKIVVKPQEAVNIIVPITIEDESAGGFDYGFDFGFE